MTMMLLMQLMLLNMGKVRESTVLPSSLTPPLPTSSSLLPLPSSLSLRHPTWVFGESARKTFMDSARFCPKFVVGFRGKHLWTCRRDLLLFCAPTFER